MLISRWLGTAAGSASHLSADDPAWSGWQWQRHQQQHLWLAGSSSWAEKFEHLVITCCISPYLPV